MKKILSLICILFFLSYCKAQVPAGVPQLFGGKYYHFPHYVRVDEAILFGTNDTLFTPILPALVFRTADSTFYGWNRLRWVKVGTGNGGGGTFKKAGGGISNLGDSLFADIPYIRGQFFGSNPITFNSSTGAIGINNGRADGTSKGAVAFKAIDFNDDGAGLISLDYANGDTVNSSRNGFLSRYDYTSLFAKENVLSFTAPLTRTTNTISINNAFANSSTKGAATFSSSDFNDNSAGLISIDYVNGQSADPTHKGFMTAADYVNFSLLDSVVVTNKGASGLGIIFTSVSGDTLFGKKLLAGAGVSLTQNPDSSITIGTVGSGLLNLNGLTASTQTFATGTSGTDVNWSSSGTVHTLNVPDVSATARGLVGTGTQKFGTGLKIVDLLSVGNISPPANVIGYFERASGTTQVVHIKNTGTSDSRLRIESNSNAFDITTGGTGGTFSQGFIITDVGGSADRFKINSTGQVTIPNLSTAGIVKTTSAGLLSSATGINLTTEVTGTLQNANLVNFKTYPPESQIGTIYERDGNFNETDLAQDFEGGNGIVFSLNSGKIRSVSSTVSWNTFGRFLPYRPTLLPRWSFAVEYTIVSAFGSNVGMGPAIRSNNVNGANYGYMSYLSASSSTATPNLALQDGTNLQAGTTFTITAGDKIRMVLSFADSVMTLTAQNLTTSSAVSTITKNFNAASAPYVPNTGTLGFSNFSGTYDISYLKFSSTATKNPTLAVAADSKGQIFAGSFLGRFPNRLNTNYPTTLNYSDNGGQLKDFLDKKIEVMSINPEQWWVILGSNDLRYGNSLTTTLNRLAAVDNMFKGTQTRVYYSVLPEDSTAGHAGIGLTALKNSIAALYPSQYIDLWTSFSTSNVLKAIYNSGDDVHTNALAHADIAAAGVASGLLTVISPNRRTYFNSSGKNIAFTGDQISLVPWGKNNVLRVDDSSRLAPSLIYNDANKLIISTNLSNATAFSGALLTVNGTFAMTGNTSALIVGDRTTPANYFAGLVNNNEWRWTYNGTEIGPYIATDGRYKIGTGGTPETIIGALNINKPYTFVPGTQGAGGLGLNVEDATYTAGAGSFTIAVGNYFGKPTIAGSGTFADAVNVDIKGAPIATGGAAITNTPLAFRVQAGKSQFNAAVQIKDGTEGNTKVFTSDANGNGSWGPIVTTGSYTPTLTAVANVAASTSALCYYYRIGTEVTVYGTLQIDPTAATTLTQIGLSIPVASTFTTSTQAAGTFAFNNGEAGIVISDASNGRAELQFTPTTGTNRTYWFQFSYHVQ